MKQRTPAHDNRRNLRRSFLSCLLAAMIVLSLLPASTLAAKAEEGLIYMITLVAGDPGYLYDEYGTPVYQKSLEFDGSAIVLDVPVYPEGYTFTGWYLDSACTMQAVYDLDTMVFVPAEQDTVLYAGCLAPASEPVMEPELTLEPVLESESVQGLTPETTPALVEEEPEQSLEPDLTEEEPAEESVPIQDGTEGHTEEAAQAQDISGMAGETAEELAGTADEQTGTDVTEAGQPAGEQTGTDMAEAGKPAGEGPILITEDTADPANPQAADADDLPELIVQEEAAVEVVSDEKQNDLLEEEYTAEESELENLETETAPEGIIYVDETLDIDTSGLEDNEVLFEKYADRVFSGRGRIRLRGVPRYNLNDKSLEVLNALKVIAGKVASGSRTSTQIVFGADPDAKIDTSITWTYEELGITESSSSEEVSAAVKAALKTSIDSSAILDYLLADCPYDMYWFAKSEWGAFRQSYGYRPGDDTITLTGLTYYFQVDSNYRGTADYTTDAAKTGAASSAAAYANSIVAAAASLSDYEKLVYYRQEICRLVSYNDAAAKNDYSGSLDPWQLIYVFDQDPDTNVVCEGYSKAFQYLCDCTTFNSSEIYCISVTGTMSGGTGAGGHMWNIVHMDDGNFYYVDVTNCDTGTIGADDKLFLAGTSGSSAEGYVFDFSSAYSTNTVGYVYDSTAWSVYGEPYLTIAGSNYVPQEVVVITLHADPQGYFLCDDGNGGQAEKDTLSRTIPAGQSVTVAELLDEASVCVRETYAVYFNENWYTSETEQNESTRITAFTAEQNMDLYAGYSQGAYKVTMNGNPSDCYLKTFSVKPGDNVSQYCLHSPEDWFDEKSQTQKMFVSWNTEADGSGISYTQDDLSTLYPESDMTLYAQWEQIYGFKYVICGDEGYFSSREENGQTVYIREQWSFPGEDWTSPYRSIPAVYSSDGQAKAIENLYRDRDFKDRIDEYEVFELTESMTVYVKIADAYVVRLDANGGYFEKLEWEDEDGQHIDYNREMVLNIVQGKDISSLGNQDREPHPADDDHRFLYWTEEKDGSGPRYSYISFYTPTSDITLYAQWESLCHVTFDAGEEGYFDRPDEGNIHTVTYTWRLGVGILPYDMNIRPRVMDGIVKAFTGWYYDEARTQPIYRRDRVEIKENMTLYAGWDDAWEIRYHANGGYFYGPWNDSTGDYDESEIRTDNVLKGNTTTGETRPNHADNLRYSFEGWMTSPDDEEGTVHYRENDEFLPTGDMDLYAMWSYNYEIKYDPNGGYFEDPEFTEPRQSYSAEQHPENMSSDIENGEAVFLGWSRDKNAAEAEDLTEILLDRDITLYAVWTTDYHTVTLDAGEGTFGSSNILTKKIPTGKAFGDFAGNFGTPSVDNPHKTFAGWSKEGSSVVISSNALYSYVPAKDETFYAVWEDAWMLTLEANDPDAYFRYDNTTQIRTVTVTVPEEEGTNEADLSAYTPRHKTDPMQILGGWNTEPDGSGTGYAVKEAVQIISDMILHAQWEQGCKVIFHAGDDGYFSIWGEKEATRIFRKRQESGYYFVPDVNNSYHKFLGWALEENGDVVTESFDTYVIPDQDTLELWAVYEDVPYNQINIINITFKFGQSAWRRYGSTDIHELNCIRRKAGISLSDLHADRLGAELVCENDEEPYQAFKGWSLTEDGDVLPDDYVLTETTTLYAVWGNAYKITFDAGEGRLKEPGKSTYAFVLPQINALQYFQNGLTPSVIARHENVVPPKDKAFAGWSEDPSGSGTLVEVTDDWIPEKSMTLYAVYDDFAMHGRPAKVTAQIGDRKKLLLYIEPVSAAAKTSLTWESEDASIAAVDDEGRITALKPGQTTITATGTCKGKTLTAVYTVIVRGVPVEGITLNKTSEVMDIGESLTLTASVLPDNATVKDVAWSSSDEEVAVVDVNGVVTAVGAGSVTITATTKDGSYTASCLIKTGVSVTGVKLNRTAQTIAAGKTAALTATVSPADATNRKVTWKSSDTTVATVSVKGVVTAKKAGTATITVTTEDGKKTAACKVTVTQPVTGVKLNKTSQTIVVGRTAALTAAVSPADATNKKVTWKSSNTAVAAVSVKGVVTAKKAGTAAITVTTEDGKKTATCKITVTQPVTGVKLNKTAQTIMAGKTAALTATVSPANASNKKVTWKSSNTAVATVSAKGVVTAKKAGTATITVTTEDGKKTATCRITVRQPVTGVKLNKTRLTMGNGQSFTLKATVLPSNAANKKVIWKSSNTKLATVSRTGKVTTAADASGTVKITATTADGKKVAACSITVMRPSVLYRTHVQSYGWQNYVKDGALSGTSGLGKRLEGINIQLSNLPYSGSVVYRTHVQSYGWQSWKKDGEMSGTSGEAKRLEGIQIYLTGELAKHYDVYYRVHAQTYGWLDYAKNGVMAGTSGLAKRLEAINIVLVPKGGKAPGSTARPYVVGGGGSLPDNPYKG